MASLVPAYEDEDKSEGNALVAREQQQGSQQAPAAAGGVGEARLTQQERRDHQQHRSREHARDRDRERAPSNERSRHRSAASPPRRSNHLRSEQHRDNAAGRGNKRSRSRSREGYRRQLQHPQQRAWDSRRRSRSRSRERDERAPQRRGHGGRDRSRSPLGRQTGARRARSRSRSKDKGGGKQARRSRSRSRSKDRGGGRQARRSRSRSRSRDATKRHSNGPGGAPARGASTAADAVPATQPQPPLLLPPTLPGVIFPHLMDSSLLETMTPAEVMRHMMAISAATSAPSAPLLAAPASTAPVALAGTAALSVAQKRTLLWGTKKAEATAVKALAAAAPEQQDAEVIKPAATQVVNAVFGTNRWDKAEWADPEQKSRFEKLMGVKASGKEVAGAARTAGEEGEAQHVVMDSRTQKQVLRTIEEEFVRSVAQAGSTMGLGAR